MVQNPELRTQIVRLATLVSVANLSTIMISMK